MSDEHIFTPDFDIFVAHEFVDDQIAELVVAVGRPVVERFGAISLEHG